MIQRISVWVGIILVMSMVSFSSTGLARHSMGYNDVARHSMGYVENLAA